ncbi:hypothetical protein [Amycolatopsis anabasis]|uniref:hypothetical protein n=1 Tax=Amycolatopsis anabasis TaxID=1840409 RepID=UPI00131CFAF7|nr:hypothetical protein [Amycolatopsis anabasis]
MFPRCFGQRQADTGCWYGHERLSTAEPAVRPVCPAVVEQAGFVVEHQERLQAGIVERVAARKPEA